MNTYDLLLLVPLIMVVLIVVWGVGEDRARMRRQRKRDQKRDRRIAARAKGVL